PGSTACWPRSAAAGGAPTGRDRTTRWASRTRSTGVGRAGTVRGVRPPAPSRSTAPAAGGFLPGRELSAAFHAEVVGPLLAGVPHSAALLGYGSDVLGYDTPVSTDHGWGPRMQVFVAPEHVDGARR